MQAASVGLGVSDWSFHSQLFRLVCAKMLISCTMRSAELYRHSSVIAAGLVCAAAVGLAGQAPPQDQPRPAFRTEANYVRVDVYATGRDGTPVGDLRRDEFALLEDRVPQTID